MERGKTKIFIILIKKFALIYTGCYLKFPVR